MDIGNIALTINHITESVDNPSQSVVEEHSVIVQVPAPHTPPAQTLPASSQVV